MEICETVQNGTEKKVNTNLGQIQVIETDSGLVIQHHVTERERFYSEYSVFAVKTAQSTVEMCRVVYEAKRVLTSADYSDFLTDIGHSNENSTIRKYLAIGAQYDKLIQFTNLLPNSWTSIYTITQLSSEIFDALTATDTDMSKLSGKEIKSLVDLNKPKSNTSSSSSVASDSLDLTQTVSTNLSQSSTVDVPDTSTEQLDGNNSEGSSDFDLTNQIDSSSVTDTNGSSLIIQSLNSSFGDVYEVLIRFKSKPTDDSWWDLIEVIDAVVDDKLLNVEVIESRPPFVS